MKKRILALLLAAVMVMALVPAVFAASPTSGKCGDNLTWRLADDTLYIEGTGDMYDFLAGTKGDVGIAPWKDADIYDYYTWEGEGLKVKIAPGVTSVGDYAFDGLAVLDVSLPEGITKIGDYAFEGCFNVKKILFPESLDSIGKFAFHMCLFESIDLPSKMTDIGEWAFADCSTLKSIRIPEGITRIESETFESCDSLSSVSLPTTLTSIGDWAFSYCKNLINIEIPKNVNTLGVKVFFECQRLESVIVPEGVTELVGAFDDCRSLKEVTIPASVTMICDFQDCRSLTDVYYGGNERQWLELKEKSWEWSKELDEAAIHYNSTAPVDPGPVVPDPEPTFTDVPAGAWYAAEVEYAVEHGLMQGIPGGKFDPDGIFTRGQILTLLARQAGVDTEGGTTWYTKGVEWAKEKGVSDGEKPEETITRAELATLLYRCADSPAVSTSQMNKWPDASSIPDSEAVSAMAWCVENGIINGTGDGKLLPLGTATRKEVAVMIQRYCEKLG